MFYAAQTKGEYGKIGSWVPEALMIMTFLAVKGVVLEWWYVPIAYVGLLLIAAVIGKFLLATGVLKYVTKINNEHNPELQEILSILKKK